MIVPREWQDRTSKNWLYIHQDLQIKYNRECCEVFKHRLYNIRIYTLYDVYASLSFDFYSM